MQVSTCKHVYERAKSVHDDMHAGCQGPRVSILTLHFLHDVSTTQTHDLKVTWKHQGPQTFL